MRELCKLDDVAYAKLIDDFYALTDAKLKFCKFESTFDRLVPTIDSFIFNLQLSSLL